jgi:ornithine carbamoyltransferase
MSTGREERMDETMHDRHLITLDEWSREEIDRVIERSSDLKRRRRNGEIMEPLKNKTLFMIFFEQSTRTRNSMEAAMTQLGGHAHDLTPEKMQITHGESPKDTAMVLSRMGEGISIRNCFYGTGNDYVREVARHASIPVLSMQDDVYHPLQAVADLMTIQEHCGEDVRGLRVAVAWAYATSHAKPLSVPQSQILLFPRYGMDVVVGHPEGFPLQRNIVEKAMQNASQGGGSLSFCHHMDEAVRGADIVIPKNWGGFGFFEHFENSDEQRHIMKEQLDKHRDWICDGARFSLAKKNARLMHALPADRGNEVTEEVLDSEASIVYDEAENRLHTAKALLSMLMG